MAYDSSRNVLVMFGGFAPLSLGDTWEWNGTDWIERSPTGPLPPPRGGAAMTFDSVRERVLMFGGYDNTRGELEDFWEWDGQSWTPIERMTHPRGTLRPAMVFDATRGHANLYRGDSDGSLFELYEWNGIQWTPTFSSSLPAPQEHPTPQGHPAMAFHAAYNQTFVIGGASQPGTWFWEQSRWWALSIPSPNRFLDGNMAYDKLRARLVYVGGVSDDVPPAFSGTWVYDGNRWVDLGSSTGPYRRSGVAMAYVDALQEVVVFGGRSENAGGETERHDDLWSWDGSTWRERL